MNEFRVIKPGFLSLLQDAGRYGFHQVGLTTGGALDLLAYRWANRLCGNTEDLVAIEASIGGLQLECKAETVLTVTGGEVPFSINDQSCEMWRSYTITPGDLITLGFAVNGCRAYIAVAGGFTVAKQFGSASTVLREAVGGLSGKALQRGDIIACAGLSPPELMLPTVFRPNYQRDVTLRVISGYQQEIFSGEQQQLLFTGEYTVSDQSDRMGYRLNGPAITASVSTMYSEGICLGAIQIPPDGQPIVLMNDRQTIGGYPKIGAVLSLDLAKLAQLMPGAKVRFKAITTSCAQKELRLTRYYFKQAEAQLQPVEIPSVD